MARCHHLVKRYVVLPPRVPGRGNTPRRPAPALRLWSVLYDEAARAIEDGDLAALVRAIDALRGGGCDGPRSPSRGA